MHRVRAPCTTSFFFFLKKDDAVSEKLTLCKYDVSCMGTRPEKIERRFSGKLGLHVPASKSMNWGEWLVCLLKNNYIPYDYGKFESSFIKKWYFCICDYTAKLEFEPHCAIILPVQLFTIA